MYISEMISHQFASQSRLVSILDLGCQVAKNRGYTHNPVLSEIACLRQLGVFQITEHLLWILAGSFAMQILRNRHP